MSLPNPIFEPSLAPADDVRAAWNALPLSERLRYCDRAEGRLEFIKDYQLQLSARTAFKRSAINATPMGGGKTLQALMHAFAIDARRTFVVLPTRLFNTWRDECARVQIPCRIIRDASDAKDVRRLLWERRKAGVVISDIEVYLISWEWLCLGGDSNRAFDPWYATLPLDNYAREAIAFIARATTAVPVPLSDEQGPRSVYFQLLRNRLFYNGEGAPTSIQPSTPTCSGMREFFANLDREGANKLIEEASAHYLNLTAPIGAADAGNATNDDLRRIFSDLTATSGTRLVTFLERFLDILVAQNEASKAAKAEGKLPPLPLIDPAPLWASNDRRDDVNDVRKQIPSFEKFAVRLLCEAHSVEHIAGAVRQMGIPLRKGAPYRYEAHHANCPQCDSASPVWRGNHCRNPQCKYEPRAYRRTPLVTRVKRGPTDHAIFNGEKTSNATSPGYKVLPNCDLLIVEEFHKAVSLETLHGLAIFNIKARERLLLSGTICRNYITELKPALALVHDAHSPEFPYAAHDMADFNDRFETHEVTVDVMHGGRRRIHARTRIPEASNVNALRRNLIGRLVTVDEEVINSEWKLPPTPERTVPFPLLDHEVERYDQALRGIIEWRASLERIITDPTQPGPARLAASRELLHGARSRVDLLSAIVNGPSKVEAIVRWIREEAYRANQRVMVVCRSRQLFRAIQQRFTEERFSFEALDEKVSNEDRHEFLDNFRDGGRKILLTRIKLVCEGFNQLVCVNRTLMAEVERNVSDNRQLPKRMNRPGQKKPVRLDFLVARLPNGEASLDEIEIRRFMRKDRAIREITSTQARFAGTAALLQRTQEARGLSVVLDDLAKRVKSETVDVEVSRADSTTSATNTDAASPARVQLPPEDAPPPLVETSTSMSTVGITIPMVPETPAESPTHDFSDGFLVDMTSCTSTPPQPANKTPRKRTPIVSAPRGTELTLFDL